jgi:DNA-binding transcriptional regulator YiaG
MSKEHNKQRNLHSQVRTDYKVTCSEVRDARNRKGLTQEHMATIFCVDVRTIVRWENTYTPSTGPAVIALWDFINS